MQITNIKIGTLKRSWENDEGIITTFLIPNSYYVLKGKVRLLSHQHWAQTQETSAKARLNYGERTNVNQCIIYWKGGNRKTVNLCRQDNVATFTLAPGYDKFKAFCCEADMENPSIETIVLPSGIFSDDEEYDANNSEASDIPQDYHKWKPPTTDHETPKHVIFSLNGPSTSTSVGEGMPTSSKTIIIDEEDRLPIDLAELLMLHHQYGHISMRKLQEMAKQGIIPRRLAKCHRPVCLTCLYSKAMRRPKRSKTSKSQ